MTVAKAPVSLRKLTCAVVQSQCRSLFAARASDHGYLTIGLIAILDVSGDRQRSNGPSVRATTRPTVAVDRPLWRAKRNGRLWPLAAEAEPQLSTVPIPADFRVRPERPELSARLTAIVISH